MIAGEPGRQSTAADCRVLFVCDAHAAMGFGHASRCLRLGKLVTDRLRRDDLRPPIAFQGTFSAGARARLAAASPGLPLHLPAAHPRSDVVVIDRMADTEDPDAWDPGLVDELRGRCQRVVYLASGRTAPGLPTDVECIGYQPGGPAPRPPRLRWGFEYAPVAVDEVGPPVKRDPTRALVALGGSPDDAALTLVLAVLGEVSEITTIDVLVSPVNEVPAEPISLGSGKTVALHRNVPSVAPLLARAGLVVASYGHLGWEALALGAPLCLVGQKRFQADMAAALAAAGLAVSAGLAAPDARERLHEAVSRTLAERERLSARARASVDGLGLARIADILCEGWKVGNDRDP
jgi:spore coat polysaccharide biosynthesis predicted glycosyltransferase SpsG